MKYLDIDPPLLKNTQNLLNPDLISSSGRQFSEWSIVIYVITKTPSKI